MNRYGVMARDHWSRHLPSRYSAIRDQETFFSTLGDEVESEIEDLAEALAGSDPQGETYLEKLGRLNMARANAESQVLRERILLEPEGESETSPASAPRPRPPS